jgi:hypothetical protein
VRAGSSSGFCASSAAKVSESNIESSSVRCGEGAQTSQGGQASALIQDQRRRSLVIATCDESLTEGACHPEVSRKQIPH